MTLVSRRILRPDVEKKIYELLVDVLVKLKSKKELNDFLDDFLSPVEKIILAKRLAIAVLIAKGNNYQSIGEILRVTPGTISKISLRMKYGNDVIRKVAERVLRSDLSKALLEEFVGILDVPIKGLPLSKYHKRVVERKQKIQSLQKEL
jgi:uncharacterized protein YerC